MGHWTSLRHDLQTHCCKPQPIGHSHTSLLLAHALSQDSKRSQSILKLLQKMSLTNSVLTCISIQAISAPVGSILKVCHTLHSACFGLKVEPELRPTCCVLTPLLGLMGQTMYLSMDAV